MAFMLTEEEWRDIPDAIGYQVSNYGRVRSFWHRVRLNAGDTFDKWQWQVTNDPKILPQPTQKKGYRMARIRRGTATLIAVHLLVLETFVGPRPSRETQGRHLDDDKNNNCLTNLAWGTQSENMQERQTTRGDSHAVFKLAPKDVQLIKTQLASGRTQRSIAAEFGISASFVSHINTGKAWAYLS